jgi:hypothetical protein
MLTYQWLQSCSFVSNSPNIFLLALFLEPKSPSLRMATDSRTLDFLLEEVAKEGRTLSHFLNAQSYYQPSFRPGGLGQYPSDLPDDIQGSRSKLRQAAKAVYQLASGPHEYIMTLVSSVRQSPAALADLDN